MPVRGNTLIDWEAAGAMLARQSDVEQVAFLRSFLRECRSWGTSLEVEYQLASVNDQLTVEERDTLRMLSAEDD